MAQPLTAAEVFTVWASYVNVSDNYIKTYFTKNVSQRCTSERIFLLFSKFPSPLLSRQQKQLKLGDKMDLWSYLLKPVQRISKYSLLLQDMMREGGPGQAREMAEVKAALEVVHFQLRHGNNLLAMDAIRDCDVRQQLPCRSIEFKYSVPSWGQGDSYFKHGTYRT